VMSARRRGVIAAVEAEAEAETAAAGGSLLVVATALGPFFRRGMANDTTPSSMGASTGEREGGGRGGGTQRCVARGPLV
jgi:hypothetical protein